MRVVPVDSSPDPGTPVPAAPARELIERVYDLPGRYPAANLRPVRVVRAPELDATADPTGASRIWLALESLQTTGSFKVRGALVALDRLRERVPAARAVAASAGNHGVGVASAATMLDVPVRIVVPRSVAANKRQKIERLGAEIVVAPSPHYDDAEQLAKTMAAAEGLAYVSPYDDVDVVLGNGTSLGFEIMTALRGVPERILAPFGGGGLATGLSWALADQAEDGVRRVWGIQSEASAAMARSLEVGHAIERLPADETLAEGLEGGISPSAFARARAVVAGIGVVDEPAIARAMAYGQRVLALPLEGSAAVALAAAMEGLAPEMCGGDIVIVLTGRNVDKARMRVALAAADR